MNKCLSDWMNEWVGERMIYLIILCNKNRNLVNTGTWIFAPKWCDCSGQIFLDKIRTIEFPNQKREIRIAKSNVQWILHHKTFRIVQRFSKFGRPCSRACQITDYVFLTCCQFLLELVLKNEMEANWNDIKQTTTTKHFRTTFPGTCALTLVSCLKSAHAKQPL